MASVFYHTDGTSNRRCSPLNQLKRLTAKRVVSMSGQALPDDHGQTDVYEYDPRPPEATIPLIDCNIFNLLLSECPEVCSWKVFWPWHDCVPAQLATEYLSMIPERKEHFNVLTHTGESVAFGLEADYLLSFWMLATYHLISIIPAFAF